MCRGLVKRHKSLLKKTDVVLLSPQVHKDDSVKTILTETSSLSSFEEVSPTVQKKSCLKVKTLVESLSMSGLSSSTRQDDNDTNDKFVNFSTIDIHTHALVLGDNPSISAGPPLTISWDADFTASFAVDEYEDLKDENGSRRTKDQLRVPVVLRREWLGLEGYTRGEMMEAQAKALRTARGRMTSAKDSVAMEQKKELVKRKFQRWVLHSTDDREKLLQEWSPTNTTTNKTISCST